MADLLKTLKKISFHNLALLFGCGFVALPCVTVSITSVTLGREFGWKTHAPETWFLALVGIALLLAAVVAFVLTRYQNQSSAEASGAGADLSAVTEVEGVLSTTVGECEVRVVEGRLEDYAGKSDVAIVLPCNEYFDDKCAGDVRSALGAYVNRVFDGQVDAFISLMKDECRKEFEHGTMQKKAADELAESYGAGRCVLLPKPLGRSSPVALVSTTTKRASQGLAARISYLFGGMYELVEKLADARLNQAVMPVLGAGHGGITAPLAFVGTLLAVAEVARYGEGAQRLKQVTIVVFKRDADSAAQVERDIVRRALALVGTPG